MPFERANRKIEDEALKLLRQMIKTIRQDQEDGKEPEWLGVWEIEFLENMDSHTTFTPKQADKIIEIFEERFVKDYESRGSR